MNQKAIPIRQFSSLLLVLIVALLQSSCSRFVTREAVQLKIDKTPNPYQLTFYFEEDEVPEPHTVTGYFEWRRIEPLTHRKNIGRKILKKTTRYIRRGNLPKPDGVIINDFLHGTYIQLGEGAEKNRSTSVEPPLPKEPRSDEDFEPTFTPAQEEGFPNLRIGGGYQFIARGGRSTSALFARANYRLKNQPYVEIVPELAYHLKRSGITRYFFQLEGHYHLDVKERRWLPLDMRAYPIAGLNLSLNQGQRRTNNNGELKNSTMSVGTSLGVGAEYRFSEYMAAFAEVKGLLLFNNSNAVAFGLGLSSWLQ